MGIFFLFDFKKTEKGKKKNEERKIKIKKVRKKERARKNPALWKKVGAFENRKYWILNFEFIAEKKELNLLNQNLFLLIFFLNCK